MDTGLTAIGILVLLATLSEGLVEYIFGDWLHKSYLKYITLVVGVALAWSLQLDLLRELAQVQAPYPVGYILTGLIMGRGSQYLHQFVSQYLPKK